MPAYRGLGRGLESLIPTSVKSDKTEASAQTVLISQIRPNRFQPRHRFSEDTLKELSDSIRQQGLIQPLIVTLTEPAAEGKEQQFELIAGERRWRAAKMAGLSEVPIIVKKVSEKEQFQFSLIENLQREDLNAIEEALAFRRLMGEFQLTQEQLAQTLGKSRVVIANTLRLLNLPQSLQDAVADGTISAGHARNLVSISDEKMQKEVAEKILQEKISVREVEKIVSDWKQAMDSGKIKISKRKDPEIRNLEEVLQQNLGTKVEIKAKGKGKEIKGTVSISYYSLDDLERLANILKKK